MEEMYCATGNDNEDMLVALRTRSELRSYKIQKVTSSLRLQALLCCVWKKSSCNLCYNVTGDHGHNCKPLKPYVSVT